MMSKVSSGGYFGLVNTIAKCALAFAEHDATASKSVENAAEVHDAYARLLVAWSAASVGSVVEAQAHLTEARDTLPIDDMHQVLLSQLEAHISQAADSRVSDEESQFLADLLTTSDKANREVYADHLEEKGDLERAQLLRSKKWEGLIGVGRHSFFQSSPRL